MLWVWRCLYMMIVIISTRICWWYGYVVYVAGHLLIMWAMWWTDIYCIVWVARYMTVVIVTIGNLWKVLPLIIVIVIVAIILLMIVNIIPQRRYKILSIKWVYSILVATYSRSTTNIRCIIIIVFISRH